MEKGILYIVFGEKYINEAIVSASFVKKYIPNIHITVFTDRSFVSNVIDKIEIIEIKHIRAKVDYIHKTPYKETIFLDSDTIINHDIAELFCILKKYDLGICHDLARKRKNISNIITEYEKIPYCFSEVNPGVIVFKNNDNIQNFFSIWRKYFYKYIDIMPWEQPTFRIALWESNINFYILPVEYNIRSIENREKNKKNNELFGSEHLKPRIYHMHLKENISTTEETLDYCAKNHMIY